MPGAALIVHKTPVEIFEGREGDIATRRCAGQVNSVPEPFLRPLRLFLATFAVGVWPRLALPKNLNRNGREEGRTGRKLTVSSKAAWYRLRVVPPAASAEGRSYLPA